MFSVPLPVLVVSSSCSRPPAAHDAGPRKVEVAIKVDAVAVAVRQVPTFITLTGSLAANRRSMVASDANGKVTATFVERGSPVAAGAPLVQLDVRFATLSATEARAMEAAARVQADRARRDCARADELLRAGAINSADHDRMTAECQATAAQAQAALARQGMTAQAVGDAIVRAPFAGVVDEKMVTVGEFVRAGMPVATIVERDPLRLALSVPESYLGQVGEGQEVRFEVQAYPGVERVGTVKYLGGAVRPMSRDLIVEAVVDNKDGKLRPGMFAVAHLRVGAAPIPVVPETAVRTGSDAARVYVVRDGRLEERLVQVGVKDGADLAIVAGVKAGEKVVAKLTPEVGDGVRVE
jgi:membrane fusion protein (multidrug efflux system)